MNKQKEFYANRIKPDKKFIKDMSWKDREILMYYLDIDSKVIRYFLHSQYDNFCHFYSDYLEFGKKLPNERILPK